MSPASWSTCVDSITGSLLVLDSAIAEMIPTITITMISSRRVNPRPRMALRIAPRERGADMASSALSDPRKRAGAHRLPALPLHFALRCAAADQQPLTLTIALMVAGWVVVAAPYVNTHCAVLLALVTRKFIGFEPEAVKVAASNRTALSIPPAVACGYALVIVTVCPSIDTEVLLAAPVATCSAFASVEAEITAARRPSNAAARADPVRLANLGAATAARMPRIRITTISSIKVKPRVCLFIFVSLTDLTTYRVNLTFDLIIHTLCSGCES